MPALSAVRRLQDYALYGLRIARGRSCADKGQSVCASCTTLPASARGVSHATLRNRRIIPAVLRVMALVFAWRALSAMPRCSKRPLLANGFKGWGVCRVSGFSQRLIGFLSAQAIRLHHARGSAVGPMALREKLDNAAGVRARTVSSARTATAAKVHDHRRFRLEVNKFTGDPLRMEWVYLN